MIDQDITRLDEKDPLSGKRDEFELPEDIIYLDGNSLGAMPKIALERSQQLIGQQWQNDLVTSWNKHHWIDLPVTVGEKIAPLLGAGTGQVICCDSISVNLFKLLCCALDMQRGRRVVVSQEDNFPADLYMVQGLNQLDQGRLCELKLVAERDIEAQLDESVAILMLTHINFRSGKLHDMQKLTQLAHAKGILVLWDLAHSAGAVPLALDDWGVDFAVGCGYKYLNGGPGAPAFIYASRRHHPQLRQPLSGWMGHADPFSFSENYEAARGVQQFLCGTPPILSMAVLDAALAVFDGIDLQDLRAKSISLGELFVQLVHESPHLCDLALASPGSSSERGSQLAYAHPAASAICQALIERGVIADFRAPDILRFGFAPLYLSHRDVQRAVKVLADIMATESHLDEKYFQQQKVT